MLSELQQFHGVRRFELERSCCFSALLLDEERGRLFVGAKNFLLSLSLDNIAKQEHKVGQNQFERTDHSNQLKLQISHVRDERFVDQY